MDFNQSSRILVACPDRMAHWLAEEIDELGYPCREVLRTGVMLDGTLNDCIRLNLHLRCATHVRYSLGSFHAAHQDDIYRRVGRIPWEDIIPEDGYFSVSNSADHFTLNNTMFLNMRVKDAVVDRFREQKGRRPDSGPLTDGIVIHVHWRDERAEVFLETSGDTISRHGYRKLPGKAPMQESLAAAVIRATGWDRRSAWINPMCGSGTLAIEAALLATGRKPGLLRDRYGFMNVLGYDPGFHIQEKEALNRIVNDSEVPLILASDIRPEALDAARENARLAGVESLIRWECADYRASAIPEPPGVVILNPEYGERMGEASALSSVYSEIGDFFKQKCAGFTGFVFTGNLDLAKQIGLKPSRRIEFYSAQLDCRLLRYELYSGSRREPRPSTAAD